MKFNIELAKLVGATRSNRWSESLDGDIEDYIIPTLSETLTNTRKYAEQVQREILYRRTKYNQ